MIQTLRNLYAHPRLPLWWRCVLYAIDHDRVPLQTRQLRDAVDPLHQTRAAEISRAIRRGVAAGMLEPESSASMLVFVQGPDIEVSG